MEKVCLNDFVRRLLSYKVGSLGYTIAFERDSTPLHQVVLHWAIASAGAVASFWYYVIYIANPEVHSALVGMTFLSSEAGDENGRSLKRESRWLQYSLQDRIALFMPYTTTAAGLLIVLPSWLNPCIRSSLYSIMPLKYRGKIALVICSCEELRFVMFLVAVAVPLYQFEVIAFDQICRKLGQLREKVAKAWVYPGKHAQRDYRSLRQLELYVILFNMVHRYFIFTWKLQCISVSIILGCAAIVHLQDHVVFGVMYYVVFVDAAAIYALVYQKAFAVPDSFGNTIQKVLERIRMDQPRGTWRSVMEKRLRSIPLVGIKVGSFNTLERISTAVFLDFVMRNIVGMLVMYS